MSETVPKGHPPVLKAKIVLDALREQKTMAELSSLYGVHTLKIKNWKRQALLAIQDGFTEKTKQTKKEQEELTSSLYQEIGRLKIEIDWLKKKMGLLES